MRVDHASREQLRYPWYALAVRSGGEERVRIALQTKVDEIFLPMQTVSHCYSDRVKQLQVALFSGYLFARFDAKRRLPILTTPGVSAVVGYAGIPEPIDESEIRAIERVLGSGVPAVPWPYLQAGDQVRIGFGPLAGLEGILLRARGNDRLVVSLSLLQRSIGVEIRREWVDEKVSHNAWMPESARRPSAGSPISKSVAPALAAIAPYHSNAGRKVIVPT